MGRTPKHETTLTQSYGCIRLQPNMATEGVNPAKEGAPAPGRWNGRPRGQRFLSLAGQRLRDGIRTTEAELTQSRRG